MPDREVLTSQNERLNLRRLKGRYFHMGFEKKGLSQNETDNLRLLGRKMAESESESESESEAEAETESARATAGS